MISLIKAALNSYYTLPSWVLVTIGIASLTFIGVMVFKALAHDVNKEGR